MTDKPSTPNLVPTAAAKIPASADEYIQEAAKYVMDGTKPDYLAPVAGLSFVTGSDDAKHCQQIRQLLLDYISGNEVQPISIVVFGPPGSGKSFYVRELVQSLGNEKLPETKEAKPSAPGPLLKEKTYAEKLSELIEVNLAQLYTPLDLSKRFYSARQHKRDTKVFFFDEFDSSLEGVSLGWLRWFLAPMQDGKFSYDGQTEEIGKSIFIFAGGTAASLNDFQERTRIDLDASREKKVPDFISRLRGYIDIRGINDPGDDRPLRRALILRHKLAKKFSIKKGALPMEEESVRRLLSNAHYIHGNRFMEALVEMSPWKEGERFNIEKHLPPPRLMELHVSRGALDGITVGISAGLYETSAKGFLVKLSRKLFENGAELAYGGNLDEEGGTLFQMVQAARNTPEDLLKREETQRIRNYLGYPAYKDRALEELNTQVVDQVKQVPLSTLSKEECKDLGVPFEGHDPGHPEKDYFKARPNKRKEETDYYPDHHLAWALSLFRMRVRMIQDLSAVIAFGGKDDGQSWGRFSGVAEEIMLALAMNKPVYVLGGANGATQAVGRLLGLDRTQVNSNLCLVDDSSIEKSPLYKRFGHAFVLPKKPDLPQTIAELRSYLFNHGVTSSTWPWNGLSPEESRRLFQIERMNEECIELITKGLTRLDWKRLPREKQKTAAS